MIAPRALLFGALVCTAALARAVEPVQLHGASDTFAAPGVAIVWGVLRGPTEDATLVVVRIAVDPAVFTHVAVEGVDPFTQQRQSLLAARPAAERIEQRTPRSRYAELPRSEVLLFRSADAARTGSPALVVYYLSIPDTTPEFATAAALGAYIDGRIAKARMR